MPYTMQYLPPRMQSEVYFATCELLGSQGHFNELTAFIRTTEHFLAGQFPSLVVPCHVPVNAYA